MVRLWTAPGGWPEISWWRAVCSESTGTMRALVASARAVTSSPPTTSDSLLARARSIPSPSAATVGPRPAEPTRAFRTRSASDSTTSRTSPSGPPRTRPSVHVSEARAAESTSASAIWSTPKAWACSTSVSQELSADSPTSSSSSLREVTSSAWVPIDPVEPRINRRLRAGTAAMIPQPRSARRGLTQHQRAFTVPDCGSTRNRPSRTRSDARLASSPGAGKPRLRRMRARRPGGPGPS